MVRITVTAPRFTTEDPEHLAKAVTCFVDGDVEMASDTVRITGTSIEPLRERIWELKIIDTMRRAMLEGISRADAFHLELSKQAAFAGKVSLPVGHHPLGELAVRVEVEPGDSWKDAEALVWYICPETKDGEIVGMELDDPFKL